MIRFHRLLPLLNRMPIKSKPNTDIKSSYFATKPHITGFSFTRHISLTSTLFNKDIVTFEEFKAIIKDKGAFIIDVREPQELKDTGVIPGSINVPWEVEDALKKLNNEEFKKKYGKEKPDSNANIVFSCLKGIRSNTAMEIAKTIGFKNSRNYIGGWTEWAEKTK